MSNYRLRYGDAETILEGRTMRMRMLLGSLGCLLLPLAPLLADSHRADSGFYVAVRAGSTFTDPATGSLIRMRDDYGSGDPIFYDSRFTYGTGVSVNGAAGYAFGALRLEAELSYAVTDLGYWTSEVRDDQGRFVNQTVVLQRLDATGLTANLWYDIDTGTVFSPFLGAGAGAVFLFANEAEWPVSRGSGGLQNYEFLWATGFGLTYHLGAGIGVEVGAGVDARFGYRLSTTLESQLRDQRTYTVSGGGTDTFIRIHYTPTVLQHRIALGLSYRF